MSLIRSLAAGLRSLFRKEQVDRELDEELTGFLEMATEEKIKSGMSREDARREVRLEMGSPEVAKEIVGAAGWESLVETSWQDLRFAARMLRRIQALRQWPFLHWRSASPPIPLCSVGSALRCCTR